MPAADHAEIVDNDSSGIDHKYERRVPVLANHQDICRFDRTGQSYQEYRKVIREINFYRSMRMVERQKKNLAGK